VSSLVATPECLLQAHPGFSVALANADLLTAYLKQSRPRSLLDVECALAPARPYHQGRRQSRVRENTMHPLTKRSPQLRATYRSRADSGKVPGRVLIAVEPAARSPSLFSLPSQHRLHQEAH
jgi:hypothetical protein